MFEHLPSELADAAKTVIVDWDLESMTDLILGVTRPRIEFQFSNQLEEWLPATFAGGVPEVPPGFEWPRCEDGFLPFVAQIDLSAVPVLPAHPLPQSGILYFFYWCTNEREESPCRVLWMDADAENLQPADLPAAEILQDWQGIRVYQQQRTRAVVLGVSLSAELLEERAEEADDMDEEGFGDFATSFADDVELELAGGNANEQDEIVLTDHMMWGQSLGYFSLEAALRLSPSQEGNSDGEQVWLNLLEVMSVGNMLWSDVGSVTFLIPASDLKQRRFDRVQTHVLST